MVQDGLILSHHEGQVGQRIEHHSLSCRSPYFVQAAQDMSPAKTAFQSRCKHALEKLQLFVGHQATANEPSSPSRL